MAIWSRSHPRCKNFEKLYPYFVTPQSEAKLMKSVVIQFEFVHANLPPTLSATQVQNVRKIMKIQLLDLVRTSPNASTCLNNIYQLLLDLGVTKSEFEKALSQLGSSGARQGSAINPKISKKNLGFGIHFWKFCLRTDLFSLSEIWDPIKNLGFWSHCPYLVFGIWFFILISENPGNPRK